ncbi:MAG: hypothetical protein K0S57_627 [Ramlibacter sp.]|nr:hypothetical protein [Ramlibacter sp.]
MVTFQVNDMTWAELAEAIRDAGYTAREIADAPVQAAAAPAKSGCGCGCG